MRHLRSGFVGVTVLVALSVAMPAGAARGSFDGNVCRLVTADAERAADTTASCTQSATRPARPPRATMYIADWGTSSTVGGPDHFMTVQVGPVTSGLALGSKLDPRRPGRYVGPVPLAPGVGGYYVLSRYRTTNAGRGTLRFVEDGYLCQITIVDVSGTALPGLEAVGRSAAERL